MEKKKCKYKVKVLDGFRIAIPKQVRERLKIKKGDILELEVRSDKLIMNLSRESPVFILGGIAESAPTDISSDKLFLDKINRFDNF